METKPFSIQSPETIAMDYGGNKQKIAQAMQMGLLDPTAGVLAGMFIDRMRSAQVMEAAPQSTVAQQVMGGAAPPTPPSLTGGPAAPSMAPPMGATQPPPPPMPAPEGAPMGMAMGGEVYDAPYMQSGGLSELPVPDTMFDENRNGGFSDGGIVAFARGGDADYSELVDWLYPRIEQVESGGRPRPGVPTKYGTAQGVAQMLPTTAREVAARLGVPYDEKLLTGKSEAAKAYQRKLGREYVRQGLEWGGGDPRKASMFYHGGPNTAIHGPKTRAYAAKVMGSEGVGAIPERNVETPAGRYKSYEDQLAIAKQRFGELPDSGLGGLEEYYRKQLDPAEREKERKSDMWMTLAQIGASMAGTNSPYLLQAAGQAIASALPGADASKKERKAAEREATKGLREVFGLRRDEQKEVLAYAKDLHAIEMGAESAELERDARADLQREEFEFRSTQGELDREAQLEAQRIAASGKESDIEGFARRLYEAYKVRSKVGSLKGPKGGVLADTELQKMAWEHAYMAVAEAKAKAAKAAGIDGGMSDVAAYAGITGGGGGQPNVVNVGGWND